MFVLLLGNETLGDDAVGAYIYRKIRYKFKDKVIFCGSVPENYLWKIPESSDLVFIDAGEFGSKPGTIRVLSDIAPQLNLSTHSTHLGTILKYVKAVKKPRSLKVILVQASSIKHGQALHPSVKHAADKIISELLTEACRSSCLEEKDV